MTAKLVVYTILAALVLPACRRPKELVYQDVQHFRVLQAGTKATVLAADVRMYNPNKFCLRLKQADVDVFVNEKHLGNVILDSLFLVPRRDSFYLPLSIAVDMANVLPGALQLLFNSQVTLKITGSIKAGKRGLYVSVPVNYEAKQDVMDWMK